MYKDKDKQREANRAAKQRQRQGMTNGVVLQTPKGMTGPVNVIPKPLHNVIPDSIVTEINRLTTNSDGTIDEPARATRTANAKRYQTLYPDSRYTGAGAVVSNPVPVRVSKPGDTDYKPLCAFTSCWCIAQGLSGLMV